MEPGHGTTRYPLVGVAKEAATFAPHIAQQEYSGSICGPCAFATGALVLSLTELVVALRRAIEWVCYNMAMQTGAYSGRR